MIFIFIALYIFTYLAPDGIVYGLCIESLICCLALTCFLKTDYKKYIDKSGWFCVLIYTILNAIYFTWFDKSVSLSMGLFGLEGIAFISMFLYSQYRAYDIKSDEYNKKDTFIILKRPDNFSEYLISCVLIPISSMSVVSKGKWYRFKKGEPLTMANYSEDDRHIYIKADVEDVKKKLKPFLGIDWKRSQNCCHIIQTLFDIKFSILDSIPAYMAHKIIKTRG